MKEHELSYSFIDLKERAVDAKKIAQWLEKTDIDTLFNKRGTTYRTLKLKALNLDDREKERWLSKENMLIKRPIIEYKEDIVVGYQPDIYDLLFRK